MTPVIEARIMRLLNNPTTCPHGSPIPGTGATLDPSWVAMDQIDEGGRATIRFISEELEEDLDLLRYLEQHGLKPGQQITVAERVPSAKLLVLEAGEERVSLGLEVAARIRAELAA
jgi:DtxR family Mn-dependent transcriptional regulator